MSLSPPVPFRNRILLLLALASGITYLDRVCISAAAPEMMAGLHLSNMEMGYIFSIFAVAYGIFEIPMGWLGDRLGPRKMLTRIVGCWSVFTVATGVGVGYRSLLAVRFAFGAGESGAYPSLSRALVHWFPVAERGKANGVLWMGARLGGAISMPVMTWFIRWFGWRIPFALFGLLGGGWCAVFWRWYRDEPSQHPAVKAAMPTGANWSEEPPHVPGASPTPWKQIFLSANLWSLFWMYFATSYGFWFLLTWLPTYLIRQYGVSPERSGMYAALPLAAGAVSTVVGGAFSDVLVRRMGSLKWGRRVVGLGGYLIAGAGFAGAGLMTGPVAAIVCLMIAEAGMDLAVPVAWAVGLEIGGNFGGTVTAFMNTASCISAFISPLAAAWVFTRFGSFNSMLISAGAVYAIAGLLWLKINAARSLSAPNRE